ncbi:4-hydroxy-tetrahydrodipicolinate synthase [Lacibacter sp. MH-610]|uniref:4-hydroxy-tetrahydrodipicolinate synthase n=1 Tax=Lacibacter sp. MH-610 TaxID=3020883 RepID=UPI00389204CF
MSLQTILRGTGVALVTPFTKEGAIDFNALEKVIRNVIDNGCEYVVTLGTTGETPVLSKEEKKELIEFTYKIADSKVPVVVGIGGNDTQALIKDLEQFPLDKAAAVLSAAPYYSKPSQEGIFQHYKTLAAVSPKPLILYNVPGRTGRNVNASTTLRLAHEVQNIAGIKEASGDMSLCMQLLKDKPADFMVVSGDDNLAMAQIACGMTGVISVAANCLPRQFSEMVRLSLKHDFTAAKRLNDTMLEAYNLLFCENNPAGVKGFLTAMGLIQNHLRLPLVPLSDEVMKKVQQYVAAL